MSGVVAATGHESHVTAGLINIYLTNRVPKCPPCDSMTGGAEGEPY